MIFLGVDTKFATPLELPRDCCFPAEDYQRLGVYTELTQSLEKV